jgi:60 kDa SS-A/Ro ribonucleoprotein
MRTNTITKKPVKLTHEGARAYNTNAEQELRRSVMACMLWEDTFYESGEDIATRISGLVKQVEPGKVSAIAIEARSAMKLRHVPLLLVVEMAKLSTHRHLVKETAYQVIQRPDELAEILAIYSRGRSGVKKLNKLSKQLQKGIAAAFGKFDEYSLAKYNQDNDIKLRDVLFTVHAKPAGGKRSAQAKLWKRLIDGELKTPDTWEVAISAAKGDPEKTKQEWTRLLVEGSLGALALLRNLRNMTEAKVDNELIRKAILNMKTERVLPFRFISAARYAPQFEGELEYAMLKSLEGFEKLSGKTVIVVDNSGSMYGPKVSAKSELDRADAAGALAILVREVCERAVVISFSNNASLVPARRGFALREAIRQATPVSGTNTQTALIQAEREGYDRIIVITDEQSHQTITGPKNGTKGYFINVANYKNGIGYGKWTHIDGWSEAVLQYIVAAESQN